MSGRSRNAAVVMTLVVLVMSACRGSAGERADASVDGTTATTEGGAEGSGPADGSPTTNTTQRSSSRSTVTSTTTSVGSPGGTPTTTTVSSQDPPAPAAPGTYDYRQSGTSSAASDEAFPTTGTLRVDAPASDGRQHVTRVYDPESWTSEVFLKFTSSAVLLLKSVETKAPAPPWECTFSPALTTMPWPATVGQTFGGSRDCGDTDITLSSRVKEVRSATVDGRQLAVYVVATTLTTTGTVESTATSEDWFAPAVSLIVHTTFHQEGKYQLFPFSVDLVSDLVSTRPR